MITYGHADKGLAELDRDRFGVMVMYMADSPPGTLLPQNYHRKHSQKMTKADLESLEVAVRCRADYLRRVEGGVYYEV